MRQNTIRAGVLDIAYCDYGAEDGWPCVMGHGFPYDVLAYAEVAEILAAKGARVIVPYLRGYGPTRFVSANTPRSGEQAALGADMLALMDALGIERAVLGGYDWGGRAACVVAALWPERVSALISGRSYNIIDIAGSGAPAPPEQEAAFWYQFYFSLERGRRGLMQDRRALTKLLWRMWSPSWDFADATFDATAPSFDNPDFVDVVIHSYRHRFGLVPGDPALTPLEAHLSAQPVIAVPTIGIHGGASGISKSIPDQRAKFSGFYAARVFEGAGHNLPQERPAEWAQAVLDARDIAGST